MAYRDRSFRSTVTVTGTEAAFGHQRLDLSTRHQIQSFLAGLTEEGLAPGGALHRPEDRRVDGSIPTLATISNSMIRNGVRASPADHPWPSMADPRTIQN